MAEGTSGGLIESILQVPEKFATVATGSPEQAILLVIGSVLTLGAAGAFGLLSLGGVLGVLSRLLPTGARRRRVR